MKLQKRQQGFTLIELVITVMILGILAIVVVKQFGQNVTGGASANALYESANKIAQNWSVLSQQANASSQVSGSPIPASGKTILDVLIQGKAAVAAAYQPAWDQAGLSPLTDMATGSAGSYTVQGYSVAVTGGGSTPIAVTYSSVPDETILQLVNKFGAGNLSTLATSDTSNLVIQYGTASGGMRDLTVLKQP